MKNNLRYWKLLLLLLLPTAVMAEEGQMDAFTAIMLEAFITLHMVFFCLLPLSKIISKNNSKKVFWFLFWIRIGVLLFFDFFVTTNIFIADFIFLFVGAFGITTLSAVIEGARDRKFNAEIAKMVGAEPVPNECPSCHATIQPGDKFCINCGAKLDSVPITKNNKVMSKQDFDSIYSLDDSKFMNAFVKREMENLGYDFSSPLVPASVIKDKIVMNTILSLLIFVFIVLIFFHFPIATYVIGIIIIIALMVNNKKYDAVDNIIKRIKERPEEKISNVIMMEKENLKSDYSKKVFIVTLLIAIALPLAIFSKPRILYERTIGGYNVRFYTFGLTNFTTAEIPDEYKGEPVVGLRGNAFSNMFFLKSVQLPDTIKEIRGQAFKNCFMLKEVNIPQELEILGGGSFYNCKLIKEVEFPDTIKEFGGEMFKGASNLKTVKLPNNIVEIRGDSFRDCISLERIEIPDTVKRIGGHAFHGDSSLSMVYISPDSKLNEIGSSAFRACTRLREIVLPDNVSINERAFKESPTNIKYYSNGGSYSKTNNKMNRRIYANQTIRVPNGDDDTLSLSLTNIRIVDGKTICHFELTGSIFLRFDLDNTNRSYSYGGVVITLKDYSGDWAEVEITY